MVAILVIKLLPVPLCTAFEWPPPSLVFFNADSISKFANAEVEWHGEQSGCIKAIHHHGWDDREHADVEKVIYFTLVCSSGPAM